MINDEQSTGMQGPRKIQSSNCTCHCSQDFWQYMQKNISRLRIKFSLHLWGTNVFSILVYSISALSFRTLPDQMILSITNICAQNFAKIKYYKVALFATACFLIKMMPWYYFQVQTQPILMLPMNFEFRTLLISLWVVWGFWLSPYKSLFPKTKIF